MANDTIVRTTPIRGWRHGKGPRVFGVSDASAVTIPPCFYLERKPGETQEQFEERRKASINITLTAESTIGAIRAGMPIIGLPAPPYPALVRFAAWLCRVRLPDPATVITHVGHGTDAAGTYDIEQRARGR